MDYLCCEDREDYIDDLWFLLHHSEGEDGIVVGLTCYLDDAGSDDGSPLVTCGGLLMSRADFKAFSKRWDKMYERNQFTGYGLKQPLHMADFVGNGEYAGLNPEFKRHLFLDVAKLVNEHKLYSISVAVSQREFEEELSADVRRNLIGPYALAFFTIVVAHQRISERLKQGPLRAAYIVDEGFGYYDQLVQAHNVIVRFEQAMGGFRHTGALATDTDDRIPPLQAADVISWGSRQMQLRGQLPEGFEPIAEILRHDKRPPHQTVPIPREGIKMLAEPINAWISKHGRMPELTDIMSRDFLGYKVTLKS
jgi:hypothetical protein